MSQKQRKIPEKFTEMLRNSLISKKYNRNTKQLKNKEISSMEPRIFQE